MAKIEAISVTIFLGTIFSLCAIEILTLLMGREILILHILSILGILSFLYALFIEPYWIDINEITITSNKLKKVHFKIVQISDLHCDKKVRNEKRLVRIINNLNPDIIIFTGDSLNTAKALDTFRITLKNLNAAIGKYAVKGNFDDWCGNELEIFKNTDFIELDKKNEKFKKDDEIFSISGINYEASAEYCQLLENLPEDTFNIFLFHTPDLIEDIQQFNIDLYLAGHTHGGQVALPFYGALVTLSRHGKKYESGKHTVGNTILYTNRGIGMDGGIVPRVRFFARPEITVFNITPTQ